MKSRVEYSKNIDGAGKGSLIGKWLAKDHARGALQLYGRMFAVHRNVTYAILSSEGKNNMSNTL